jgi:hypothetical protein
MPMLSISFCIVVGVVMGVAIKLLEGARGGEHE